MKNQDTFEELRRKNLLLEAKAEELKKIEIETHAREEIYRALIDNMSSAVAVYKASNDGNDFIFVDFNKAGESIERISRERLIGRSVKEVFPGVVEFGLVEVFKRVWKTGKSERFPVKVYQDKRIRGWRENFVYKLQSGEVVSIYTDETSKMEAIQDLQASEIKFRTLFEQAPLCIAHMDHSGRLIDVNSQVMNVFGYSKEDFLRLKICDLFIRDQATEAEKEIDLLLNDQNKEYFKEALLKHKTGEAFFAHLSIRSVRASEEMQPSFICLFEDISERKQSEKKILESLKEKEVLLREIHHRVKNNMQVICSLLSLQTCFSNDIKLRQVFDDVNQQIRAMGLAHELLYQSSNLANFKAREYIMRLVEQIIGKTINEIQHIKLNQNIDDILIDIEVAIPLGFIITELISNCLKHAFRDCRRGCIDISLHSKDDHWIELVVSDDGVGIPQNIDFKNPKSLGLELVGIFVQKLNGSIKFNREKVGTKATVLIKNELA